MSISPWQIEQWGSAPNEREETKCQQTVERIKSVLQRHFGNSVDIYLQGSYRNRTNVRKESDVDIVVEHVGYFFHDISRLSTEDQQRYNTARTPADYQFSQFKVDIQNLMIREFGSANVQRKNKCIYILQDQYRVNADVVPCYTYKRFYTYKDVEAEGIALLSDQGILINSFPKQHYNNGAQKNIRTNGNFKSIVRALKVVRNQLVDSSTITEETMRSFLLECLVWNVADSLFLRSTLHEVGREVITKIWSDMQNAPVYSNYAEVSNLQWLLRGTDSNQKVRNAIDFMTKAWKYIGYS
jgi:predicted nucleotidyltransferase